MRFRLAICTLTMLGCTVHSQSTYIEYGGGQRDTKPPHSHAKTAKRPGKASDAARRQASAAADETPKERTQNTLPAPHESGSATDRLRDPATLGHGRTGMPVASSTGDKHKDEAAPDEPRANASGEKGERAPRRPELGGRETRGPKTASVPREADNDGTAKTPKHAPIADSSRSTNSVARQHDAPSQGADLSQHKTADTVVQGEAKPAHGTDTNGTLRARATSPSAEAPTAGPTNSAHRKTVSTDAAYKRVLRTRDERLPEDPKTATLKKPDERVR